MNNDNVIDSTIEANSTIEVDDSTIEQQAYKELYERQLLQIKEMREEIANIKLANQKLAIQQNIGTPKITAEELINKMFN